jgi:hypothetical protein
MEDQSATSLVISTQPTLVVDVFLKTSTWLTCWEWMCFNQWSACPMFASTQTIDSPCEAGLDCSLLGSTPAAGPHGLLSGLAPGAASAVKVAVIDLLMAQPPTPPAYSEVASAIAAAAAANAQLARKSPKNAAPTPHQQRGAGTGVAASPFAAVSPRMASVTGR